MGVSSGKSNEEIVEWLVDTFHRVERREENASPFVLLTGELGAGKTSIIESV